MAHQPDLLPQHLSTGIGTPVSHQLPWDLQAQQTAAQQLKGIRSKFHGVFTYHFQQAYLKRGKLSTEWS